VRRAARVPCWCKSSQTVLQAGSEAKGGGNASPGAWHRGGKRRSGEARIYGDGELSAKTETSGMSARRLGVVDVRKLNALTDSDAEDAGQGAHREVGSEGFAANHRAVARTRRTSRPNPR
jgi:hypothetical protein